MELNSSFRKFIYNLGVEPSIIDLLKMILHSASFIDSEVHFLESFGIDDGYISSLKHDSCRIDTSFTC